jgi:hypothetical protein
LEQLTPLEPMADQNSDIDEGNSADDQSISSAAEILRDLNNTGGEGLTKDKPAAQVPPATDKPAATEPTGTPAAAKTDQPKTDEPPVSSIAKTTTIPKDPEFANRNKTSQSTAAASATDDPTKTGAASADKKDDVTTDPVVEQKFYNRLSEMTGGYIKSENDFKDLVTRYNELATQAEEGFKPKFRNDAQKYAHDLLSKAAEGQELDVALRTLQTLKLDPAKLSGKNLLFESYLLDPDNSDLTREKAWEYFDESYEKRFANVSTDKLTERELQKEERKAREQIMKAQKDFKDSTAVTDPETPQVNPEVIKSVERAVGEFGGFQVAFKENAPDNELLTIKVDDPSELEQLKRYTLDPQEFWKDLLKEHSDEKGFNYNSFVRAMWEFKNIDKVKSLSYDHGLNIGKRTVLNKDRNSSDAGEGVLERARVPAGVKKEAGSFGEAFAGALGVNV